MEHKGRSPRGETSTDAPKEEVVRLPVSDSDLASQLEEMPAPGRRSRRQPTPAVDLHEEELEDAVELSLADLGMSWEEDEETAKADTPIGWIVLIGLTLVTLTGWSLAKLSTGESTVEARAEEVDEGLAAEAKSWQDAEKLYDQVLATTRDYLLAGSIPEKAEFVRHPQRVVPLMESHYDRHEFKPAVLESIEDFRPFAIEGRPFIYVEVKLEGGEVRHLSMEQMSSGELKFDWESEVAYQPIGIEEFVEAKPTEPVDLRVYARWDSFYSYEFSDSERYQAFLLSERDSDQFLYGYMVRGTDDERELMNIIKPTYKVPKPVLLRVRFLPGTRARRSVLVERLVSPRWIYAESPERANPASE